MDCCADRGGAAMTEHAQRVGRNDAQDVVVSRAPARLVPGTKSARVADLVLKLTRSRGHAITVIDTAGEYVRQYADPAGDISSCMGALVRLGVLARIPDRPGSTRYIHHAHPDAEPYPPNDECGIILTVLTEHWDAHAQPMATRALTRALAARGVNSGRAGFQQLLDSLARSDPRRGVCARIACETQQTSLGALAYYWRPASAPAGHAAPPGSHVDAVRQAFAQSGAELGRGATRNELLLWQRTRAATNVIAATLADDAFSSAVLNGIAEDGEHVGKAGRIHLVPDPWACHGGAPRHYTVGCPDARTTAVCRLASAFYVFQPGAELRGIERLNERGRALRIPIFCSMASARRRLLLDVLYRAATSGDDRRDPSFGDALDVLERAQCVLDQWYSTWVATANTKDWRVVDFRQTFATARGDHRAAACLYVADMRTDASGGATTQDDALEVDVRRVAGEGALVSCGELAPLAQCVGARLGVTSETGTLSLYQNARRFPGLPMPGRMTGGAAPARIDRVDALLALFRALSLPRTTSLFSMADLILGAVVRDPWAIAHCLKTCARDALTRRALVVALGLLGSEPAFELAVPDSSNTEDVRAYVLALVLTHLDPRELGSRLADVHRTVAGPALHVTDVARGRVAAGLLVSAVE